LVRNPITRLRIASSTSTNHYDKEQVIEMGNWLWDSDENEKEERKQQWIDTVDGAKKEIKQAFTDNRGLKAGLLGGPQLCACGNVATTKKQTLFGDKDVCARCA
jgi:hypothetical protein